MATGDLTTLASVRELLRTPTAQTDADALLTTLIAQASAMIRMYTGREFASSTGTASATRIFQYFGGGLLVLDRSDLVSVTSVTIDTETTAPLTLTADEDYYLMPVGGRDGVYDSIELRGIETDARAAGDLVKPWREVTIVGVWGFSAVPADVKLAANLTVAHIYRQLSSVPGNDLAGEGDRYGPVALPSAAMFLLSPYRHIGFGGGA